MAANRRVRVTVTLMILGLGILFPLTGLAIAGMLGLDSAWIGSEGAG